MGLIKKLLSYKKTKNQKKLLFVFDELIEQSHLGNIGKEESGKNLEESLIEIVIEGQHSSNGVLITDNGYFLTAKHCVDEGFRDSKIRLFNGKTYPIKEICAYAPKEDLALAKANIPKKFTPKEYFISPYDLEKLKLFEKIPVVSMARRNGEVVEKYGFVHNRDFANRNRYSVEAKEGKGILRDHSHILLDISLEFGDSGGIILNPNKELIGIVSSTKTAIRSEKMLGLIEFYKKRVEKKLTGKLY